MRNCIIKVATVFRRPAENIGTDCYLKCHFDFLGKFDFI